MVTLTDLNRASMLSSEMQQLELSISLFDDPSSRITDLTVTDPQGRRQTVPTSEMAYPPQMVEAIKNYLRQRHEEIRTELSALGITGTAARRK